MNESLYPLYPVLIVDDEEMALEGAEMILNSAGMENIITCSDSTKVMGILEETEVSVILLDLIMPNITGDELLVTIKEKYPDIPVVILTGSSEVEKAVKCMKANAYDYMLKPVDENRLISVITRALEYREMQTQLKELKGHLFSKKVRKPEAFDGIITNNKTMLSNFQYIETIAISSQPVLITGETGVGKERIAQAVHNASGRKGEFVSIAIAGLDETVFSDTLFGHLKGAYTGAMNVRDGLVKKASGGTLFLDEIGDLSMESQVKLLRLIQEREFYPLGSDVPARSEARIVCATNRNLKEMVEAKQFRSDLYYRLNSHQVNILPLRSRLDDLPYLLDHFLELAAEDMDKKKPTPPPELISLLRTYHFPGNIREFKAMVFDAVAGHTNKMLNMSAFKKYISENRDTQGQFDTAKQEVRIDQLTDLDILPTIKQASRILVKEAMRRTNNNQSLSAQMLGITRQTLAKYMD